MSKGPSGVENPKMYGTYLAENGRWMVFYASDGKPTLLPDCYVSEDDAKAVMAALNAREIERYKTESLAVGLGKPRKDG
jgi:hypothetical protein